MTAFASLTRFSRSTGLPSLALVAVLAASLALTSSGPGPAVGLLVIGVSIPASGALRRVRDPRARSLDPLPIAEMLVYLTIVSPITFESELVAGALAIALLLWLSDDPDRPPGTFRRAGDLLALPVLGFGLTIASSLLVPPGELQIGVASLLLALGVVAVAVVLARPSLVRREPASS